MLGFRFFALILSSLIGPTLAEVVNLASLEWTLNSSNGTISIPSTGPPCQAHIDLLNAGIITEPLLGINGTSLWFPGSLTFYSCTQILRSAGLPKRTGLIKPTSPLSFRAARFKARTKHCLFSMGLIRSQTSYVTNH